MKNWFCYITLAIACVCGAVLANETPSKGDDLVYVYCIYDPGTNKYFQRNTFGLSAWGPITEAEMWTIKKRADRTLAGMYGTRAERCVIKKFFLMPAKE